MNCKTIRSLLFVPGSRPERFSKALNAGADMICIDLEDAVLPSDKKSARMSVIDFIANCERADEVCVRINPVDTDNGKADLKALSTVNFAAVMIAKCSSANDVNQVETTLTNSIDIIPLIESIQGLDNASQIASASKQVRAMMFGGADMSAELRCEFSYEALLFVRSQLVLAAARENIALIDVPYVDINNESGLMNESEKVRALGFCAKAAIHPRQIDAIHGAFSPTKVQIDYAEAVLEAVDNPDAGAVVVQGKMVDRPIILASQRIVALAKQSTSKN